MFSPKVFLKQVMRTSCGLSQEQLPATNKTKRKEPYFPGVVSIKWEEYRQFFTIETSKKLLCKFARDNDPRTWGQMTNNGIWRWLAARIQAETGYYPK